MGGWGVGGGGEVEGMWEWVEECGREERGRKCGSEWRSVRGKESGREGGGKRVWE